MDINTQGPEGLGSGYPSSLSLHPLPDVPQVFDTTNTSRNQKNIKTRDGRGTSLHFEAVVRQMRSPVQLLAWLMGSRSSLSRAVGVFGNR